MHSGDERTPKLLKRAGFRLNIRPAPSAGAYGDAGGLPELPPALNDISERMITTVAERASRYHRNRTGIATTMERHG